MNSKIPRIFDSVLSKVMLLFIGLIVGGYLCPSPLSAITFSIVFSVCFSGVYLAFIGKENGKVKNKNLSNYRDFFLVRSEQENLDFFASLLKKRRNVIEKQGFILVGKIALFCKIRHAPLTPDEVVSLSFLAKKEQAESVVILCDEADNSALSLAGKLTVKTSVLRLDKVARLVNALGGDSLIPKEEKHKKRVKDFISLALSKSRAKGYLIGSITMFFLSAVTSFSLYYLVFAVVLLALSVIAKLQKN